MAGERAAKRPKRAQTVKRDVYEADIPDLPEEVGRRYDAVESYEYELPEGAEDEEIDEDEAFNSGDEQRYAGWFGTGKHGLAQPEEEGEEGSYITDDFSEEEGSEAEQEEQSAADHCKMLEGLFGKASPDKARVASRRQPATESVPESQLNLPPVTAGGAKLTLGDLVAGLEGGPQRFGPLAKQVQRLQRRSAPAEPLLPGPIRARQQRKAGYEGASQEVAKWQGIVKANREAPTLRFADGREELPRSSTAAMAATFRPSSSMEQEIADLLKQSGTSTEREVEQQEEEAAMKELTAEQVRERQQRLAHMRAVMLRHQEKAKHLAKIKSKDYHRRGKRAAQLQAAKGAEDTEDGTFLKLAAEEAELNRARERLTQKHRNTSRWARRALKRGQTVMDDGTRAAIEEQLRLGQELRQRANQAGQASAGKADGGSSTDASDPDGSGSDEGEGSEPSGRKRQQSKTRAAALDILQGGDNEEAANGLFALPFMRRALERQKAAAQADAAAALQELDADDADADYDADAAPSAPDGRAGRMAFTGSLSALQEVESLSGASASDEDEEAEAKRHRRRLAAADDDSAPLQPPSAAEDVSTPPPPLPGPHARKAAATPFADATAQMPSKPKRAKRKAAKAAAAAAAADCSRAQPDAAAATQSPRQGGSAAAAGQAPSEQPFGDARRLLQQMGQTSGRGHLFMGLEESSQPATPPQPTAQHAAGPGLGVGEAVQGAAKAMLQHSEAAAAHQDGSGSGFIPAPSFAGPRKGMAFKQGPQGQGCYADSPAPGSAQQGAVLNWRVKARQQKRKQSQQQEPDQAAGLGEAELAEAVLQPAAGHGMSQRELIAAAFAGDDVQADFQAAKAAEVEAELPQEDLPQELPGWGLWASQRKAPPKWLTEAKDRAAKRKEAAAKSRQDAKRPNVIISERWDKKAARYTAPQVPFPFSSREAFEGSRRHPLGSDFNTLDSHKDMVRPAVLKQAGVIIQPLKFSKAAAKQAADIPQGSLRTPVSVVAAGVPHLSSKR